MAVSAEELKASLEGHNSEFEDLLRLIPAKYYLVPEDNGEYTSKYQKNSRKLKAPKQAIKEASKKAKRDRLDPANNKTIVELQEEAAASKKNNPVRSKGKKGKAQQTSDDEDQEANEAGSDVNDLDLEIDVDEMAVDTDSNDSENPDNSDAGPKKTRKDKPVEFKPMEAPTSIETLRSKLRARMDELRQKNRRRSNNPGGGEGREEMSSKDELLEERRKQRAAMREKRRKETKEKKRREEEERKRKGKEKQQATSGPSAKNQLLVPDPSHPSTSGTPSNQTTIAFSSLSGSKPHVPKSLKTPSNPTLALSHVQSHLSSLNALPASKREQVSSHEQYTKASARLSGAKIHDDPQRLAKAAKRREKEKEKSKKEWGKRKEEVVKAQAARQKKRTDNIAMRNEKRKGKGKGKGKGQKRPGFEGKSFGAGTSKKAGSSSKGKGRK